MRPPGRSHDNTDRLLRIRSARSFYALEGLHMLSRGVPVKHVVAAEFPFLMETQQVPPLLAVEFTNYCNLRCVYCTSSLKKRPQGFMTAETFERVLSDIGRFGIRRVRIVGNGECTIHPDFSAFVRRLRAKAAYLSILSNGQWSDPELASTLVEAVDLVEISADAGADEEYESSRPGASMRRLRANLDRLVAVIRKRRARTTLALRIMYRPSQAAQLAELLRPWRRYTSRIVPQRVLKRRPLGYDEDVFEPVTGISGAFPRCSLTLKALDVNWNGDVPLCSLSSTQIGGAGLILGNVRRRSLDDLWHDATLKSYQEGHRNRCNALTPICRGCPGC